MLYLTDIAWPDPKCIYILDGSSFIQNGIRYAGVVMDLDSVIRAMILPPGTSAQKAEVKALTQALKIAKGAIANIYTDSRWDY
jgi:ribonuclease HI